MLQALLFITIILFSSYALLIYYYRNSWNKITDFRYPVTDFTANTKITVIIPARNEEENIRACIDSILLQTYPLHLFEIIVVDDHSDDPTASIVLSYTSNVKLISLKEYTGNNPLNSYKKKAIEIAIAQSSGDLIVTTDADCIVGKNWLQTIAAFYQDTNAAFIAAPVAYYGEHNFLTIFQSLDFMTLQGITGASVSKKMHSMCNGANLAYEKKAFYEVDGFKGIDSIASGDDMLLMHKIFTQNPDRVLFLKSQDAIVQTTPMNTLASFFNQRIRWASKADKYDDKRILAVLVLVYLFNALMVILPVITLFGDSIYSLFNVQYSIFEVWIWLLFFKTIIEIYFLLPVAYFFSKEKLLWWFPLAQPFHIVYTVIAGWLGKFGSYKWKDRSVQ